MSRIMMIKYTDIDEIHICEVNTKYRMWMWQIPAAIKSALLKALSSDNDILRAFYILRSTPAKRHGPQALAGFFVFQWHCFLYCHVWTHSKAQKNYFVSSLFPTNFSNNFIRWCLLFAVFLLFGSWCLLRKRFCGKSWGLSYFWYAF